MKVKVAKTAGFCFGVKRAVDKVYQLIEQGVQPIYTLGPIIHNEEVVSDLADRGVQVIEEQDLEFIINWKQIIWTMLMLPVLSYLRYTALSKSRAGPENTSLFSAIRITPKSRESAAGASAHTPF